MKNNTVADRLKWARSQLLPRMTQADVAGRLGVIAQQVSDWETGKHVPGAAYLEALADLYGTSVGWILRGSGSAPTPLSERIVPRGNTSAVMESGPAYRPTSDLARRLGRELARRGFSDRTIDWAETSVSESGVRDIIENDDAGTPRSPDDRAAMERRFFDAIARAAEVIEQSAKEEPPAVPYQMPPTVDLLPPVSQGKKRGTKAS